MIDWTKPIELDTDPPRPALVTARPDTHDECLVEADWEDDGFAVALWVAPDGSVPADNPAIDGVRSHIFTYGHRNVVRSVAGGLTRSGSVDGYVWETMRTQGMSAVMQTEVVWKSEVFGFPPLVTRRGSNHLFFEKLRNALLAMTEDNTGREVLNALNLSGFSIGSPALFASIRRQARRVNAARSRA